MRILSFENFIGDPGFFYDFLKICKITLLVDLLTFVVIKYIYI